MPGRNAGHADAAEMVLMSQTAMSSILISVLKAGIGELVFET
jgi:hypothetical protein